jgi:hypothetical protein
LAHGLGCGRTLVGVLGQQRPDQLIELRRKFGTQRAQARRDVPRQRQQNGSDVLAHDRRPAAEHAIQNGTEAVQVAAVIDFAAAGLLGGHVVGRPDDEVAGGQAGHVVPQSGQAKIEDLHVAPFVEPEILGFDVAMDEASLVRGDQSGSDLAADS